MLYKIILKFHFIFLGHFCLISDTAYCYMNVLIGKDEYCNTKPVKLTGIDEP